MTCVWKHVKILKIKECILLIYDVKIEACVEQERAIGMLQAMVMPSVIAQQFWCHARMIEHLRNGFPQTGTTSDYARSWRHRVMMWRQDRDNCRSKLLYHFCLVTVTARTTPVTHDPRISTQAVTNRLLELGEWHLYIIYMRPLRRFFFSLVYWLSVAWVAQWVEHVDIALLIF